MNTVSAGPIRTMAGKGIPGFDAITDRWGERAPLGWDPTDAAPGRATRWRSCCPTSRAAIAGEMIHVDGGFHAMGI